MKYLFMWIAIGFHINTNLPTTIPKPTYSDSLASSPTIVTPTTQNDIANDPPYSAQTISPSIFPTVSSKKDTFEIDPN